MGGDRRLRRHRRDRAERPTRSATTTSRAASTSRCPVDVAAVARRALLRPARDVRLPRARAPSTIRFADARARARLPPPARDRQALRHARRGQRRPRDPRRRRRFARTGVRRCSARRSPTAARGPTRRSSRCAAASRNPNPSTTATLLRLRGHWSSTRAGCRPRVPIWIGGRTARSLRRAVELGDGWAPFGLTHRRDRGDARSAPATPRRGRPRTTPIDVMLQPERPLDPARRTRRHAPTCCSALADTGATGVNARFVHHSLAHYLEQLDALATVA